MTGIHNDILDNSSQRNTEIINNTVKTVEEKWKKEMKANEKQLFFGVKFDGDPKRDLETKYLLHSLLGKRGDIGKFYLRVKDFFDKNNNVNKTIGSKEYETYRKYLFNHDIIKEEEWVLLRKALSVLEKTDLSKNTDFQEWIEYNKNITSIKGVQNDPQSMRGKITRGQQRNRKVQTTTGMVDKNSKERSVENVVKKYIEEVVKDMDISEIKFLQDNTEDRIVCTRDIIKKMGTKGIGMNSMNNREFFVFIDDILARALSEVMRKQ